MRRYLEEHQFASIAEEEAFYTKNIIGAIISVLLVGLIAGLFLGLMTLDALDLRIIGRASVDEDERKYAAKLLPIVSQRHRLLVTLLILNALAYETLPIFLDALVPSWAAILLSTTLILLFGEIVPSAIFTGPNQLRLGYLLSPLVLFMMMFLYPIAMPLTCLLDYLVLGNQEDGDDPQEAYNRRELSALIRIQYEEQVANSRTKQRMNTTKGKGTALAEATMAPLRVENKQTWNQLKKEIIVEADSESAAVEQLHPPLHKLEVGIITGALQMKTKVAMDVYTPLRQVYALSKDLNLTRDTVTTIYSKGFSRVPVYRKVDSVYEQEDEDRHHVLGFLMTRQLMLIDWDHEREVSTLPLVRPMCISPRMNLIDLLKVLKKGGSLMAFVCARPDVAMKALKIKQPIPSEAGFMGIITLEDVMECILQDHINDEWDVRDRDRAVATLQKWAANKLKDFIRKKTLKGKLKQQRSDRSSAGFKSSTTAVAVAAAGTPTITMDGDRTPLLQAGYTHIGVPSYTDPSGSSFSRKNRDDPLGSFRSGNGDEIC
jgi:metal transporter CNNM